MSIDAAPQRKLSDRVAEEVRVALVRRRMSGRELARKLDVSPSWVSYRLTGTQPIDLNDLQRIAEVLGLKPVDLLPAGDTRRYADRAPIDPLAQRVIATIGQPRTPQRATLIPRPPATGNRLDTPPRPDRAEHHRRPVATVTQAARSYAHG